MNKIKDWFWSLHLKKWIRVGNWVIKINIDRVYKWKSLDFRYNAAYKRMQLTILTFYITTYL